MTVPDILPAFPDVACPDCHAPAGRLCHWYCPRYNETPDTQDANDADL